MSDEIRWEEVLDLDRRQIAKMGRERFTSLASRLVEMQQQDRKENALLYYQPVSKTSRRIHTSTAQTIGVGGGNGCLPLSAPVLMANGEWKTLGSVVPGDRVIAVDPESGQGKPARVVRTFRSGVNAVYRFTASDGGSFECTPSHRVPLYLGSGRRTSKGNRKRPHKRVMRDYIDAIATRGAKNPSKRISAVSPGDIQFEEEEKLAVHPYLLGALLGDGSFTGGSTPKFHNVDDAVIERVRHCVELAGGELRKYKHGCEFGIVNHTMLRRFLDATGLAGVKDVHKFIPQAAFRLSRAQRMELAAGLVDTDGTTDWFTSASSCLAHGFARLIRTLGGKATIRERETDSAHGRAWSVYWRTNERLPLSIPRKQAPGSKRPIDYTRRVLRSVEYVGHAETGDIEVDHPSHCYVTGDYFVVSNSSKTETCLVDLVVSATGVIPESLKADFPREKIRGPINCRVVCESLTSVLHPVILPKLQWFAWTGVDAPGGDRGHWGWIPRTSLIGGSWDRSWSEKLRILRFLCRDPDEPERVLGESTIQFMSHDNDDEDFASGDFHIVMLDEPPSHGIWRENQARTMRVSGRMMLAMTWPDDPSIPVDWIFDEIYEPGEDPEVKETEWINLYTTDNPTLDQDAVALQMSKWSAETMNVRIYGRPIRFSNRVHPDFTDQTMWWCFDCRKAVLRVEGGACQECRSENIDRYCHVLSRAELEPKRNLPTVYLLDPHPRKPHMMIWVQIDPQGDFWQIAELEVDGEPAEVAERVFLLERELGLHIVKRMLDPNMGRSPAGSRRNVTWQDEFDKVGLRCDLADDGAPGRKTINGWLKPDPDTRQPRMHISEVCPQTIFQFKRYVWDDFKRFTDKDQKQVPKTKNDDYPTLWKYLANEDMSFRSLEQGSHYMRSRAVRRPPGGRAHGTSFGRQAG